MSAKDLQLRPITPVLANETIRRLHYSGKVVQNSQLHLGVYWRGHLEGALQFGPSLDKSKLIGLVEGTGWNEFIELNRLAFSDALPRNSESRALAVSFRLLRQYASHVKWVISFADATQSGDGAIYRATGFVLTSIKENGQLYRLPFAGDLRAQPLLDAGVTPDEIGILRAWLQSITPKAGQAVDHRLTVQDRLPANSHLVDHKMTIEDRPPKMSLQGAPHAHKMSLEGGPMPTLLLSRVKEIMRKVTQGATSADQLFRLMGGEPAEGFQLRYIYFLDPSYRARLTIPEIPYSRITEMGAGMYRGEKRAAEATQ